MLPPKEIQLPDLLNRCLVNCSAGLILREAVGRLRACCIPICRVFQAHAAQRTFQPTLSTTSVTSTRLQSSQPPLNDSVSGWRLSGLRWRQFIHLFLQGLLVANIAPFCARNTKEHRPPLLKLAFQGPRRKDEQSKIGRACVHVCMRGWVCTLVCVVSTVKKNEGGKRVWGVEGGQSTSFCVCHLTGGYNSPLLASFFVQYATFFRVERLP